MPTPPRAHARIAQWDAHLRPMSETKLITTHVKGHTHTLTLTRPEALNALNHPMVLQLEEALASFIAADGKLLVLANDGRAFCAGGDVLAVVKVADSPEPSVRQGALTFFRKEYEVDYLLSRIGRDRTRTALALMDGITMGGGVGLSSPLRLRVATERTLWAMPETGIGFFPDVGVSRFLSQLDGGVGLYLALTGHRVHGWEAYYLGLATHFLKSSDIAIVLDKLNADEHLNTEAVDLILRQHSVDPTHDLLPNELGKLETSPFFGATRIAMDYVFSLSYPKHKVGDILRSLEQLSTPESETSQRLASRLVPFENGWKEVAAWAEETLAVLHNKSPRSLVVTHRHMGTPVRSLEDSYERDMRRAIGFCNLSRGRDFYTGVTHVLEKDPGTGKRRTGRPGWVPSSVQNVDEAEVDKLFFSPEEGDSSLLKLDLSLAQGVGEKKLTTQVVNPYALPSEESIARVRNDLPAHHTVALLVETLQARYGSVLKPGLERKVLEWMKRTREGTQC